MHRHYDVTKYSADCIFFNETGIFFESCINKGLNVYHFVNIPIHNIIFSENDINFLKKNKSIKNLEELSINIKKIKQFQCEDLLYFYDNLIFELFYVLPTFNNNQYCFNLIVVVKNNFDLENFMKINFNIFKIKSVNKINISDLNFNFIKNLLELSQYSFFKIIEEEDRSVVYEYWYDHYIDTSIYKDYKNSFELEKNGFKFSKKYLEELYNKSQNYQSFFRDSRFNLASDFRQLVYQFYYVSWNFRDEYTEWGAENLTYSEYLNSPIFTNELAQYGATSVRFDEKGELISEYINYSTTVLYDVFYCIGGYDYPCINAPIHATYVLYDIFYSEFLKDPSIIWKYKYKILK